LSSRWVALPHFPVRLHILPMRTLMRTLLRPLCDLPLEFGSDDSILGTYHIVPAICFLAMVFLLCLLLCNLRLDDPAFHMYSILPNRLGLFLVIMGMD
jgi:hypothetical protein